MIRITDGLYQLTTLTYIIRFFFWGFIITESIRALSGHVSSPTPPKATVPLQKEAHKAAVRFTKGVGGLSGT